MRFLCVDFGWRTFFILKWCDYYKKGASIIWQQSAETQEKISKTSFIQNTLSILQGDGDFRSQECIELLNEADIVVTNPPFSLFREYVAQLINYNKKFLIIGNINAITYKEIFKLIKDEKIWGGYIFNKTLEFEIPNSYEGEIKHGKKYGKVPSITWFTNLETTKRNEELPLYKNYNSCDYPSYYKYDAINVKSISDIPQDYYGKMGVPITFIDHFNPEQFEIIGLGAGNLGREIGIGDDYTEEEMKTFKKENKAYRRGIPFYYENNKLIVPYARIIIRRKK